MISKLLASIASAELRNFAITAVVLLLAVTHYNGTLLGTGKAEAGRDPASEPARNAIATEKYVDSRIADLDAKSALRHESAMQAIRDGQMAIQRSVENLGARVDNLARYTKHVAMKEAVCKYPPETKLAVLKDEKHSTSSFSRTYCL